MKSSIHTATRDQIYDMLREFQGEFSREQVAFFRKCIYSAGKLWAGFIDGELVCFWGLMPPSLLSDKAYLWLYTTPALEGNEFYFIRKSQIAVKLALEEYAEIIGHVTNVKAIRWIKWVGGEFSDLEGPVIPFRIRRK